MVQTLFDQELWDRFEKKIRDSKSNIKTYPQLDPYFDFSKNSDSIKNLVLYQ
jgi:RNA-directed DNA polymerase